ncbi:hypothetical protein GCM10022416_40650 [Actinomadura keratinilytica]|jgi:CBS domain-containing protein|uniref:CBS domain-containing protein n=2 Tax=Actinomadura keratinilytica TaxID=547461 RepID=A0ABP7Z4W4_9ACTN
MVIGARGHCEHGDPLGGQTVPAVLIRAACEAVVCADHAREPPAGVTPVPPRSAHGRPSSGKVTRRAVPRPEGRRGRAGDPRQAPGGDMRRRKVADVMTTQVVTVAEETPFIEIVEAMAEHGIHAVPVVGRGGRVTGIVTDADLLRKQEYKDAEGPRTLLEALRRRRVHAKADAVDARGLMTAPAVTVPQDASVAEAARLLARHGFKQAPVVDADGRPAGIVTRADLLRVFLRSDDEIRDEIIREVLVDRLWQDPSQVAVRVQDGVVQLTGRVDRRSMIPVLVRLAAATEGVVDVQELLYYKQDDTIPESYRRV